LFGISKQMLAGIAFAVVTKMGKTRYAWVTAVPMAWLLVATLSVGVMKVFSANPKIGFFAHANMIQKAIDAGKAIAPMKNMAQMHEVVFNDHLDAIVTLVFVAVEVLVVLAASRVWYKVLFKKEQIPLHESEFIPAASSAAAIVEGQ
jgi:carbon starvation protein